VELNNDFEVSAPIDKAWLVLTDVERIAPCLPGAQLQEVEGDEYRGIVKVKVGPITAQYKGAATFVEKDDAAKRAVLKADGRDTRGAGNASAFITAQLTSVGDRTKVEVKTDLTVTGKVAQFGRGVMADVSAKLMGQFADNLEKLLEADNAAAPVAEAAPAEAPASAEAPATDAAPTANGEAAAPAATAAAPTAPVAPASTGPRKINMPEPQAVDLLDTAGAPVLKRLAPVLVVLVVLVLLRRKFRRSK
jgi:carbon monoxide dehydrogenase subunit G